MPTIYAHFNFYSIGFKFDLNNWVIKVSICVKRGNPLAKEDHHASWNVATFYYAILPPKYWCLGRNWRKSQCTQIYCWQGFNQRQSGNLCEGANRKLPLAWLWVIGRSTAKLWRTDWHVWLYGWALRYWFWIPIERIIGNKAMDMRRQKLC